MITVSGLFLILAIVCFLLAALKVGSQRLDLVALGFLLWLLSQFVR